MTDPTPTTLSIPLLGASIVTHVAALDGIRQAQYRFSTAITTAPFAIVYPADPETQVWTVTHEPGQQVWLGQFLVHVGIARLGDTQRELASIDPFVHRLVDHFAIDDDGHAVPLPDLPDQPDRCYVTRVGMDRAIPLGEHLYAGVELALDVKFRRINP